MKKIMIIGSAIAVVACCGIIACNSGNRPSSKTEGIAELPQNGIAEVKGINETQGADAQIRRGQYLVTIMGCNDCHSPKVMTPRGPELDSSRLFSGHPETMALPPLDTTELKSWVLFNQNLTAFAGPWGVTYASNLSSDESGIGNWTEEQWFKALREGKYKGMDNTRPLLPPMPWQMIGKASDEDLRAIFAFLKSTKPVENRVPAPVPPNQLAKLK
jgi:cytochrome c553